MAQQQPPGSSARRPRTADLPRHSIPYGGTAGAVRHRSVARSPTAARTHQLRSLRSRGSGSAAALRQHSGEGGSYHHAPRHHSSRASPPPRWVERRPFAGTRALGRGEWRDAGPTPVRRLLPALPARCPVPPCPVPCSHGSGARLSWAAPRQGPPRVIRLHREACMIRTEYRMRETVGDSQSLARLFPLI
jgi:hypothetical protein